jgi:hypothetical protein
MTTDFLRITVFFSKGAGFYLSQSLTQAYSSEKYSIIVNNKMNNE